jgi:hypothetical protein
MNKEGVFSHVNVKRNAYHLSLIIFFSPFDSFLLDFSRVDI